jgi:hypothetical protein
VASNVEKLHAAGMLTTTEIDESYVVVIEELTPEEVEAIISVKLRLDEAHESAQASVGKVDVPHYSEFLVPF